MPDKGIRILAAIMFTDIAGYTALMQENEDNAKMLRDRQKEVLEEIIFSHRGQILQYYGDGTLSIFGSVVEAVRCAVEIQQELRKEPQVPLRIGLHAGDIVYDDEGVYGDGVNIASRIETLSVPGAVLISERVNEELRNQPDLRTVSLGVFELKNVRRPMEVFALKSESLVVPDRRSLKIISKDQKKTIAVLPFINLSGDPENEYFSDGMTEEILNALTRVDGLLVTSRTSSFAFKSKNLDIREIGKMLGVETVLEGSVRKYGNKIRVTAQLINTTDGYHIWSETYDRDFKDIFDLQDEISGTIAHKLREKFSLTGQETSLIQSKASNLQAYNLFLKGRFYWNKWTPENALKAIEYYEEAIKIDPGFALPYAGISNSCIFLAALGRGNPSRLYERAQSYALKALELDKNSPITFISLALVKIFYEWDWKGAKQAFETAVKLSPGSADVHHTYSYYYLAVGDTQKAVEELQLAASLDPLSLPINQALADAYYANGEHDKALDICKKNLDMDPNFRSAKNLMAWIYVDRNQFDEALNVALDYHNSLKDDLKGILPLGYIYAVMGEKDKALECLSKLKRRSEVEKDITLSSDFAVLYAGLGDIDNMFEYLNRAVDEKSGAVIFLNSQRGWMKYKDDKRFKEIIRRIGFPEKLSAIG
ncbi:MAG: adenylate/guanylate cyclase domain-containing protein [Ignavibacteriaceae bacterium]